MKNYIFYVTLLSILFVFCKPPENSLVEKMNKDSTRKDTTDLNNMSDDSYSDWIKYEIKGLGEIYIPKELEIQEGIFKEMTDKLREINGLKEPQIVFQQKGLNEYEKDAFSSYARVMIKTKMDKVGEIGTLYDLPITITELEESNDFLKEQMELVAKKQNSKITEWYPVKIATVNGMSAMLLSYKRKMGTNPEAYVRLYQFHNYDRIHYITLSYRMTEEDKWEPIFDKILNSLKIIEIK